MIMLAPLDIDFIDYVPGIGNSVRNQRFHGSSVLHRK